MTLNLEPILCHEPPSIQCDQAGGEDVRGRQEKLDMGQCSWWLGLTWTAGFWRGEEDEKWEEEELDPEGAAKEGPERPSS